MMNKLLLTDEELQAGREIIAKALEYPGFGYGVAVNAAAVSFVNKIHAAKRKPNG